MLQQLVADAKETRAARNSMSSDTISKHSLCQAADGRPSQPRKLMAVCSKSSNLEVLCHGNFHMPCSAFLRNLYNPSFHIKFHSILAGCAGIVMRRHHKP